MMRSNPLTVVALCALTLSCGSSSQGTAVCSKLKQCCSVTSSCDAINSNGVGFEDRCGIEGDAYTATMRSYKNQACDKIADTFDKYLACLAALQCADISATDGHVAKCDSAALDYCTAQKLSGDACGGDRRNMSCDNVQATATFGATVTTGSKQSSTCKKLIACYDAVSGTTGTLDSSYGPNGTCWSTTQATADACTSACSSALSSYAAANPSKSECR